MQEITPTKHEDGTETVTLWGKTVDVTGKKKITVFKRDFKLVRPKKMGSKSSKKKKSHTDDEATNEGN